MSVVKIIPAQKDWWLIPVSRDGAGKLAAGQAAEIVAWHVEPIYCDRKGVEDFISTPVTIYGTIDFEFGVIASAGGKFYCQDVAGIYDTAAQILQALEPVISFRNPLRPVVAKSKGGN
jgi:hypothetical protein